MSDDPIFAAIRQHETAHDRFIGECWRSDTVFAERRKLMITDADATIFESANAADEAAALAFVRTVPATMEGVRAMLAHYRKHIDAFESAGLTNELIDTLWVSPALNGGTP